MRFRLTVLFSILLTLVFLRPAAAQLTERYAGWADGPEGFLLTDAETNAWKKITTDDEARDFIDLFWARRNPHPEAAYNEFRARFEGMVKYCDENFGYEGKRGALSDMGRVFLLMGPPHEAQSRGTTQTVSGTGLATTVGQSDRGSDQVNNEAKLWVYDPARLDPRFKAKGSRILFTFYEERQGKKDFVLDRSHREATMSLRILKQAPEVYLLHPDMTAVPKPISVPGGTAAAAAQLEALAKGTGPMEDELHAMHHFGVADADHRPLWVHVGLPKSAPPIDHLAGRVLDPATGEVLSTFQTEAKPFEAGTEKAYHLTFPLPEGTYTVEYGGFENGTLEFAKKFDVDVKTPPTEGTWLSDVLVGLNVTKEPDAMLGEAYNFGGWHLMPLAVPTAPKSAQLSYFGYVVRPVVEEGQEPQAKLNLTLMQNGKRLGRPLRMDLPLTKVAEGVYMYGNALNLAAFPPGKSQLEFKISVDGTDETATRTVDLELVQ